MFGSRAERANDSGATHRATSGPKRVRAWDGEGRPSRRRPGRAEAAVERAGLRGVARGRGGAGVVRCARLVNALQALVSLWRPKVLQRGSGGEPPPIRARCVTFGSHNRGNLIGEEIRTHAIPSWPAEA